MFLATQYLQFVLGFTPFQAGVRTLPFAGAMMVAAPLSSKVVERLGTKRVVVGGMLLFSLGLIVASTSTVTSGYGRVVIAMTLMGTGMGLVMAPATESIMGALPPEHAGVGSAMNDTTREVGAALGVAVIGSLLSSFYVPRVLDELPATVPEPARAAAEESVGAALGVSAQLGRAGVGVADAAREAFVYAMQRVSWVAAAVGVLGALIAWRFLPARAGGHAATDEVDTDEVELREAEFLPEFGPIEIADCADDRERVGAAVGGC